MANSPSSWGIVNVILSDPSEGSSFTVSEWGTENATLEDTSALLQAVALIAGVWTSVTPVYWDGSAWTDA